MGVIVRRIIKILGERSTASFHSGIVEGTLPTPHTHVHAYVRLNSTAYMVLDPLAIFEQFEHWIG